MDDYRAAIPNFYPVIPDFCAAIPNFYPAIPNFYPRHSRESGNPDDCNQARHPKSSAN